MRLPTAETWALVVGIETYAFPEEWDADLWGPALDAVEFVNWLLDCGVDPDRIRLCLSARDVPQLTKKLKKPVRQYGASAQEILKLLDDEVSGWTGKLLYVFWGGHGALDAQEKLRLYFSDASEKRPLSLSFSELASALRHKPGVNINAQAFILDVCRSSEAEWRFEVSVTPGGPAKGGTLDGAVRQFEFFAARSGQAAINLNAERTGAFSKLLLNALKQRETPLLDPKADWPPDLVSIAQEVQQAFEQLRTEDPSAQVPIFDAHDWNGQQLLDTSPHEARQRTLLELGRVVGQLSTTASEVLAVFRATFPDSPKLADVGSMADILDFLRMSLRSRSKAWAPEAELAERLYRRFKDEKGQSPKALQDLKDWLGRFASLERESLRQALDVEDADVARHLVVELVAEETISTPVVKRAWLYRADRKAHAHSWTEDELAAEPTEAKRLIRLIREARARGGAHRLVIELITPRRHLPYSPDSWKLMTGSISEALGNAYPVLVRWRERLADPDDYREGRWLPNLERAIKRLTKGGIASVERLTAPVDYDELWRRMDDGDIADLLVVDGFDAEPADTHPLMLALLGGAPALCWWQRPPADETRALAVLTSLLKTSECEAFTRSLFHGRKSKNLDERSVAIDTILFWDHPDRNPYRDRLSLPPTK